ncbi:hypothetical protein PI23P_00865 [Polaribacter irgensii 23-P]|uniref:Uncharacterized protein n=1 Tax=Polaribacter irgensii 23-P TaxID=313594 RepID=A4C2B0_9FLAO|nr:hypothetical protein [Polaribacter irgensii]EAR11711.1 hypothetical protein PI23P_00865 [Polaribacter irgensii 23-P]
METKTNLSQEENIAQLLELAKEDNTNITSIKKNTQFIAWTLIISMIITALSYAVLFGKTGYFRAY